MIDSTLLTDGSGHIIRLNDALSTNLQETFLFNNNDERDGIAHSRLTGFGKGETEPIANNKTNVGRTKNCRIELKTNH